MRTLSLQVAFVITLFGMLHLPTAQGAVDAYLKIKGVKGESTQRDHAGWIDVISISWSTRGGGGTARSEAPLGMGAGSVTVVKQMDSASRQLMQFCSTGEHVTQALLHVRDADSSQLTEYVLYDISLFNCSPANTGGTPTETISINYSKVSYRPPRITPKPKIQGSQSAR